MPKMKTHKATAKRIKITRNKKIIQRTAGQNHFNSRESGKTTRNKTITEITSQVDQQKQRIQKLQDMLVDNKIDPEDYSKMKSRFEEVKEQLLLRLRQIKSVRSNFEKYLQSGINLLGNLEKYYHASDIEVKQQLIGSIFPEKLVFVDGKVRTARINEVLRLILLNDKSSRNMKKGQLTSNLWLSSGVEADGVEPA